MGNTSLLGSYGGQDNSALMFRNRIINGNCLVSQRGAVSAVNNAATYGGADRFFVAPLSFTTVTAGSINKSALSGTSSGFGQWLTGFTCTGSGTLVFGQRIESQNTLDLNSKQVTFTGVLYQNTGNTVSVTVAVNKANAVDNFTGVTAIGSTSVSVASGVTVPFSLTVTLGSADANNGLSAEVTFTGLSNITTKNFAIGDFQLEAGPTATPFERRPIGVEQNLCFRYYQKISQLMAFNQLNTANEIAFWHKPVVPMRAAYTVTVALANADYVATGPTGNQWTLYRPGTGYSTKTGPVSWVLESAGDPVDGNLVSSTGATFSGAGNNKISASGTSGIYLNAEL